MTEWRKGPAVRRALAGSALGALLTFALFAGTAGAHKRIYETTLTFQAKSASPTVNEYSGKVESERAKCERYRTINVDAFDTQIATATSLINGDWLVQQSASLPPKGTTLIAFTKGKVLKRNDDHRHKCSSDFAEKKAP